VIQSDSTFATQPRLPRGVAGQLSSAVTLPTGFSGGGIKTAGLIQGGFKIMAAGANDWFVWENVPPIVENAVGGMAPG
jgi:hypothetical protein